MVLRLFIIALLLASHTAGGGLDNLHASVGAIREAVLKITKFDDDSALQTVGQYARASSQTWLGSDQQCYHGNWCYKRKKGDRCMNVVAYRETDSQKDCERHVLRYINEKLAGTGKTRNDYHYGWAFQEKKERRGKKNKPGRCELCDGSGSKTGGDRWRGHFTCGYNPNYSSPNGWFGSSIWWDGASSCPANTQCTYSADYMRGWSEEACQ